MQWVLHGSRQQLRSHVISLGPYGLACQRSLRWRVVMKDREESSIEWFRLTVWIRYSLYRINFFFTSNFPNDLSHNTQILCVYMSLLLPDWFGQVQHTIILHCVVTRWCNKFLVTSNLSDHTKHEMAVWWNTITLWRCILM